jgi:hypothetical protein
MDWDTALKMAQTFSYVAVPLVVAIGGWLLQRLLQRQSISRDYVQLAITILSSSEPSRVPPEIRSWAVDLLNQNSPIKLDARTIECLKSGDIALSGFQFVPSRALTPALKQELETSLNRFKTHLTKVGFPDMEESVAVDIRPGNTVKIGGQEFVAVWDRTTDSIIVARAFANDTVSVLRQLAHKIILASDDLSNAYSAIKSGLASYFPCSFTNCPMVGENASKAGKLVFPSQDLRNRRQFSEIDLKDWSSVQNDGSVIWGGTFWQVRELLGSENADRLLARAWQEFAAEKQEDDGSVFAAFASRLLEQLTGTDYDTPRLRTIFEERGLRL